MATRTQETPKNLALKLAAIAGSLARVPKAGQTTSGNIYSYATKDDVYDLIRAHLSLHNIHLYPQVLEHAQDEVTSKAGAAGFHSVIKLQFTFADGDSGETFACEWRGESTDYGDKGLMKAVTLGTKYFLLTTFLLSTGDSADDEQDGSVEHSRITQRSGSQSQTGNTVEDCTTINVKLTKDAKPYCVIGGASFWNGDLLDELEFSEDFMALIERPGQYDLPYPVSVAYKMNGNYKNAVRLWRKDTGVSVDVS